MLTTIKQGSTGDLVKVAQYLMKYSELGKANGKFDLAFSNYVTAWQDTKKLTADGIIGSNTWNEIAKNAPTCSTSKNKKSAYTCAVQILIGGLTVDGIYGTKTKNAVAAYQSANKLDADGICGPKTWNALIVGNTASSSSSSTSTGAGAGQTVTGSKVINNCVNYLQWDSKWKNVKYSTHTSSQTIGNSGCGPSSMAQIMATFIDKKITPVEMCALALNGGYRTYNGGTAWGFYEYVFKKYDGFSKFVQTSSIETLKAGLKDGALAVCSMNNNDNSFWSTSGHFITAIGYDDTYIYANDPNKSAAPRKQAQSKFKSCMKQAFIFWPKLEKTNIPKDNAGGGTKTAVTAQTTQTAVKKSNGTAIIDISKWQGTIDFDKLKEAVALVIVRASCGSDKDVKFDEYAKAMKDKGIPFGVYCYSYAGTTAKAKDEVQKMVSYAKTYKPLFYVMDAEESKITNETISAFADELKAQKIKKYGCYVAHNHYKDYDYDSVKSKFGFTWIPRYGKNDGTVENSTKPSYKCDLWQYTSAGKIAGINGKVDMNVITGDGHNLDWFLS